MVTAKRTCKEFLIFKFGSTVNEKRALFERELDSLFNEYKQWHRDNNYGKNPSGVKKQLFKKWLLENNCYFIPKRGK